MGESKVLKVGWLLRFPLHSSHVSNAQLAVFAVGDAEDCLGKSLQPKALPRAVHSSNCAACCLFCHLQGTFLEPGPS